MIVPVSNLIIRSSVGETERRNGAQHLTVQLLFDVSLSSSFVIEAVHFYKVNLVQLCQIFAMPREQHSSAKCSETSRVRRP